MTVSRRTISTPFAYLLSFLGGFHVMAIEMCAFRTLQWTYGSSIYVSGALLTLIMVALAAGYRVGGIWSTKSDGLAPLFWALLAAAAYLVVADHLLVNAILQTSASLRSQLTSLPLRYSLPPALTTVLLYLPPMLGLSLVSPFLAKALLGQKNDAEQGGLTIGTVMAVSTLGSIAGTLMASFVLVPFWGVDRTLALVEVTTIAAAGGGLLADRRRASRVLGVAALVLAVLRPLVPATQYVPQERKVVGTLAHAEESLYGPVALYSAQHDELGSQVSFMSSHTLVHSMVYPQHVSGDVFTTEHMAPGVAVGAKRWLVLGAALGGAIAATLEADPEAQVVAVEIDPLVARLARAQLPVLRGPNVTWVLEDARAFLRDDTRRYDAVLVDVTSDQQIPGHCVTWQFFELVRQHLAPGGLLTVNTNMATFDAKVADHVTFSPLRHVTAALRQAGFQQVLVSDFFETGEVVASVEPRDVPALRASLRSLADAPHTAPGMKAAAAVLALGLQPMPESPARALSDDWVVDHLLHLRDTWDLAFGGMRAADGDPRFREGLRNEANDDVLALVTLHLTESLAQGGSTIEVLDRVETKTSTLCDALHARASRQGWLREYARAVHTTVAGACARRATEVPAPEGSPAADYFAAAEALAENRVNAAWPALDRLLHGPEFERLD